MLKIFKNIFVFKLTKEKTIVTFILLAGLSFVPIFYKLSAPAINNWDEAFYAVNSAETTFKNNLIVLTEHGTVSHFNSKPPFVIWMQSVLMHLIGINELSVRLPSALATFVIVIALFFFGTGLFGSITAGFAASMTFLTADGFITAHVARTGDLDAMVSMWIVLYCFIYIRFLSGHAVEYSRIFYLTGFLVTMAFLSKSIAGFMPLPGIVICTLLSDKRKRILSNQHLYYSAIGTVTACVSFCLLREYLSPGYLKMVWNSEILRFNNNITPWHAHPPLWFVNRFINETFLPYIYILPIAILAGLTYPDKKVKSATLYLTICCISYLFLISFPEDKLGWYDAPLYPFFSILIGILFFIVYQYLLKLLKGKESAVRIIIFCMMIALFYKPYRYIYNKVEKYSNQYNLGDPEADYAKKIYAEGFNFNYKIFYTQPAGNNSLQLYFYKKAYEYNKNIAIDICDSISQFKINDTIMVCQPIKKNELDKQYSFNIINQWNNCLLIVINKVKNSASCCP